MKRCAAGLAVLALCCTDPRARPVPPDVRIHAPLGQVATSPGAFAHTVTAYDADGLDSIVVSIVSAESTLVADSSRVPFEIELATESYTWSIPAGIPRGTVIRILAQAWDFADFVGADTLEVVVDTTAN